jgi:hypothetical protein
MKQIIDWFDKIRELDPEFEESYEIELDNLDKAKVIYNDGWGYVVENEHGSHFPLAGLSKGEQHTFAFVLMLEYNKKMLQLL